MPMTVITLTNVPKSLRGDLTKWMQEISVGVYIGNFNSRVREELWKRVTQNIGNGQATMAYSTRNELGYQFEVHNAQRQNIDYDGIPLVLTPVEEKQNLENVTSGFSNVAKMRKIKNINKANQRKKEIAKNFAIVDIETDGLDKNLNSIIEIGALKVQNGEVSKFSVMIQYNGKLPLEIKKLTGINDEELFEKGQPLKEVLQQFTDFIDDIPLVGYSIEFDIGFINSNLKRHGMPLLKNKQYDLLNYIRKEKMFLRSYKLKDVLGEYGMAKEVSHRGLKDAEIIYELSKKVNGFLDLIVSK